MAKVLASIADGRVVPWFSEEDPPPAGFVVVPPELHGKFAAGEIADGMALARAALAANAEVGVAKPNTSVEPPPPKPSSRAKAEKGEPSFPSVTHLPSGASMRA